MCNVWEALKAKITSYFYKFSMDLSKTLMFSKKVSVQI